ncbi:MAG: hypothetical protein QXZ41_05110 [Ignisphaera sp.]
MHVCKDVDAGSWKLHLRIADYSILDFYRECVDEMLNILLSPNPKLRLELLADVIASRKSRISRDKKRYWRISCDKGKHFLLYVDLASIIQKYKLIDYLEVKHAAGLAIVPVVILHNLK